MSNYQLATMKEKMELVSYFIEHNELEKADAKLVEIGLLAGEIRKSVTSPWSVMKSSYKQLEVIFQ